MSFEHDPTTRTLSMGWMGLESLRDDGYVDWMDEHVTTKRYSEFEPRSTLWLTRDDTGEPYIQIITPESADLSLPQDDEERTIHTIHTEGTVLAPDQEELLREYLGESATKIAIVARGYDTADVDVLAG